MLGGQGLGDLQKLNQFMDAPGSVPQRPDDGQTMRVGQRPQQFRCRFQFGGAIGFRRESGGHVRIVTCEYDYR